MCAASRSTNFIIGLTDVSPAVRPPTLWDYDVCGQWPGVVGLGVTVHLRCVDNLPPRRYVVVQLSRAEVLNFGELQVFVKRTYLPEQLRLFHFIVISTNVDQFLQAVWPPGSADTVCPRPPPTLTFDRLTLKLVCESHLRWGTFLPNKHARPLRSRIIRYVRDERTKATLVAPSLPCGREHNVWHV